MPLPQIIDWDQLTTAELQFVQNLAGLSYAQGDILHHNGTNLTRLGIGSAYQVLGVNSAGNDVIYIDKAPRGVLPISTTGGTTTLTVAQFENMAFDVSGVLASNATIEIPDGIAQMFIIDNETSGAFTLTVKHNATSGVTIAQGERVILYTTGTQVESTTTTGGGGSGTVTSVSVVTANGVSGSVATPTTTPAITLTLGVITPTSVNGLTLSSQAVGFTIAGGTTSKTLTVPLDASVSGTNTGDNAANSSTMYIGTTAVALNRASAALVLTGITSIDGLAATATALATPRAIYGNNFDGTAALAQVIASTYGGTGNGFTKFTGPTTAEKTFTLPDSNATLLYSGGALGTPSSGTLTNCTGLPVAGITDSTTESLGVGSIELGHATDTTIARSGAGDITIEGNAVYRAGGTDVAIADGGTGASTALAAMTNLAFASKSRVYLNGAQTLNDTVWTKILMDTEVFDVSNEYSTVNSDWTAGATGYYQVSGQVYFTSGLPTGSFISVQLYDGTNTIALASATTGAANEASVDFSTIVYVTSGTVLTVHGVQVSGGNRALKVGSNYYNYFAIHRLS